MAYVDFENMLVFEFIIRQQQLAAQGIAERDYLMGDAMIRLRLRALRAECQINEAVLMNLPVSLFLSPRLNTRELPMILFLPWDDTIQLLRKSNPPIFNQIQQEEETFHEDVTVSLPEVLNMDVEVEKTSIKEEKPEKIEKLITTSEKERAIFNQIQQEEETFHEDVIVSVPEVLNMDVEVENTSITEEKPEKIEKVITTSEKERATFEEEEILDFTVCSKVDFVIKPYEEIEVYIVEFEMGDEEKSYYMEKSNAKIWRKNATWNKVKLSKLSRTSKAIFKVP